MENNLQVLENAILEADEMISKNYMSELSALKVIPLDSDIANKPLTQLSKFIKVDRISYSKNDNYLAKLSNIYNVLMDSNSAIVFILDSDGDKCDLYLGVRDFERLMVGANCDAIKRAFSSNFPGTQFQDVKSNELEHLMDEFFQSEMNVNYISSVSGIASLKNEDNFVQGIENFIDAMKGEKFTAIFIANAVNKKMLFEYKRNYEALYTRLSMFSTRDISMSENENLSISESIAKGVSQGIVENISISHGITNSEAKTQNMSTNQGRNILSNTWVGVVGGKKGTNVSEGSNTSNSTSEQENKSRGTQNTESHQTNKGKTLTTGKSTSYQMKIENKSIQNILDNIDMILDRLKACEDLGGWECAAYFIAENKKNTRLAANSYKALMRGKNSSAEPSYVNIWNEEVESKDSVSEYLKKLMHPKFMFKIEDKVLPVSGTSIVSGNELAIQFGMPQKSVQGIPVIKYAPFGREVIKQSVNNNGQNITLGNIYHMGEINKAKVQIDIKSLTMHTFVTGTTGAGKSNTVYYLLNKLKENDKKFLIIEPAKGEYKDVFGGLKEVNVFGTNPKHFKLLKINPFSFCDDSYVAEHIDGIVEMFNACWSMYAAMPALLKKAIIRMYEAIGWDINEAAFYGFEEKKYPNFLDLLNTLPNVIEEADYSEEVKSNYKGALLERVRSLVEGVEKSIFLGDDIPDQVLFDQNCIIDLSRTQSAETKSLLMGIIIMKMKQYRYSNNQKNNLSMSLKHVTVLEEAHNLLRKTSFSQSQEGSNLQGKSVEIISNAIAEMRSKGEGFIIVDQSPSELDESVIRNTNTKIIHRLTSENDYSLVGRSAGIKEEQISEVPRLRNGVAAVYQNNWIEPVLCKVPIYTEFNYFKYNDDNEFEKQRIACGDILKILLMEQYIMSAKEKSLLTPRYAFTLSEFIKLNKLQELKHLIDILLEYHSTNKLKIWSNDCTRDLSYAIYTIFDEQSIFAVIRNNQKIEDIVNGLRIIVRKKASMNNVKDMELLVVRYVVMYFVYLNDEYSEILQNLKKYSKN